MGALTSEERRAIAAMRRSTAAKPGTVQRQPAALGTAPRRRRRRRTRLAVVMAAVLGGVALVGSLVQVSLAMPHSFLEWMMPRADVASPDSSHSQ